MLSKQRILCLGNNTQDTDRITQRLAVDSAKCHNGLLSDLDEPVTAQDHVRSGFYHSSVYDIDMGRLIDLANSFDLVIMLDQPMHQWSHPDAFYNTVRIMQQLRVPTEFLDPTYCEAIDYFKDLVRTNPSFCAFPFIELLVDRGSTTVCCRSTRPIVSIDKMKDFGRDPHYRAIRDSMVRGERVPEHCQSCYTLEDLGLPSARQQETVEWANRLNFRSIQDFQQVSQPVYYEVRPSNRCNLQCRMCGPSSSHLIDREYQRLGIIDQSSPARKFGGGFEIVNFQNLKKLYLAGGEPLIMPETYAFLDRCIKEQQTDFEFVINTNGTKLSKKLQRALDQFGNLQFIFSIDAFRELNHYIRWPSEWDKIIGHWRLLKSRGHKVMVNTTVSIYNVHKLHELYEFIDVEFPGTLVHCQIVQSPSYLSPWLFPDKDLALESLSRVAKTNCARNDPLFADSIQSYVRIFQDRAKLDPASLLEFFRFNDRIDAARNISLADYVPALELSRNLVC